MGFKVEGKLETDTGEEKKSNRLLFIVLIICGTLITVGAIMFFATRGDIEGTWGADGSGSVSLERIQPSIDSTPLPDIQRYISRDIESMEQDLEKLSNLELRDSLRILINLRKQHLEKATNLIAKLKRIDSMSEDERRELAQEMGEFIAEYKGYDKTNFGALSKELVAVEARGDADKWMNKYSLLEGEKHRILREKKRIENLYSLGKISSEELMDKVANLESKLSETDLTIKGLREENLDLMAKLDEMDDLNSILSDSIRDLVRQIEETSPVRVSEIDFTIQNARTTKSGEIKAKKKNESIFLEIKMEENVETPGNKHQVELVIYVPEFGKKTFNIEIESGKSFKRNFSKSDFSDKDNYIFPSGQYLIYIREPGSEQSEYITKTEFDVK